MNAPRRLAVFLVCVLSFGCLSAQTTFVWSGNAVDFSAHSPAGYLTTSGNWLGEVSPTSSIDNTVLEFGSSAGLSNYQYLSLQFPYSFAVYGLNFAGPVPFYDIISDDGGTLRIGAGGMNFARGTGSASMRLSSKIELGVSQTWNINDGYVEVAGPITQTSANTSLTQTGIGTLNLKANNSDFSGGFHLQGGAGEILGGAVKIHGSSTIDANSTIVSGPLGTGQVRLGDYTTLANGANDHITIHNAITLGNFVTFGESYNYYNKSGNITLAGTVTPTSTNTTLRSEVDGALFILGAIGDATGGATTLTFASPYYSGDQIRGATTTSTDGFPVFVLGGNNTYTGATIADNAGVIFYTPGSLGQTSSIMANDGYVGTGYSGGMEAILGKIADKTAFAGALGFDTNPDIAPTPTTFADNIDLRHFTPDTDPNPIDTTFIDTELFWGIGSMTSATLTGTITPPSGGNYVFGGGSGKLFVQSNLGVPVDSASAGVRMRSFEGDEPLTVWLQGNNSFTGKLYSDHSIVVLDSATALPALDTNNDHTGRFQLDSGAYVGYTERFTGVATPADFIARLYAPNYNSDSILGFDSYATDGRTITDPINLSALNDIFIGTTTHVHLAGTITAPSSGQLSITGVNGGWLTIDSPLLAPTETVSGVSSLNIGSQSSDLHRRGIVELTSGNSTFNGGTMLNSGYLLLGASSTVEGGVITKGPLGTGTINVGSYYSGDEVATIAATASGITLDNNIHFYYGSVQFGVPVTTDGEHLAYSAQAYTGYGLTLNGNLTGTASTVSFTGNGTFTLNGDNSGFSGWGVHIGNYSDEGAPRVVANTNTALGSASNTSIYFNGGGDLVFGSGATAPSVGSLSGYHYGETDQSFIALTNGATLTVNQHNDSWLYANIGGAPSDSNFATGVASDVSASLVKTGTGNLTLAGDNHYTGQTTIKQGMLIAGHNVVLDGQGQIVSGPFGSSTIVLDGGTVGAISGVTLRNSISFGAAGGTLGGNGVIASDITAGVGVTIAPGSSPGQLTFTSDLTFASGGIASFDISNFAGTAGSGWDQIVVDSTGTFAITATIADPFKIQINSWDELSHSLGALSTDTNTATSITILQSPTAINLVGDGTAGASNLVLDTSNFTAYQPGTSFTLSLSADSTSLLLNFTPVPEPSTYALFGAGLLLVAGSVWRSKRSRRN